MSSGKNIFPRSRTLTKYPANIYKLPVSLPFLCLKGISEIGSKQQDLLISSKLQKFATSTGPSSTLRKLKALLKGISDHYGEYKEFGLSCQPGGRKNTQWIISLWASRIDIHNSQQANNYTWCSECVPANEVRNHEKAHGVETPHRAGFTRFEPAQLERFGVCRSNETHRSASDSHGEEFFISTHGKKLHSFGAMLGCPVADTSLSGTPFGRAVSRRQHSSSSLSSPSCWPHTAAPRCDNRGGASKCPSWTCRSHG